MRVIPLYLAEYQLKQQSKKDSLIITEFIKTEKNSIRKTSKLENNKKLHKTIRLISEYNNMQGKVV